MSPLVSVIAALSLLAGLLAGACGEDPSSPPGVDGPTAVPADEAEFASRRNEAFRLYESGAERMAVLAALLQAHALRPEAFGVNERLGRVYADLKLNEDAVRHFERALAVRPEDTSVTLALATLLVRGGEHERAVALLPALAADPAMQGEALYLEAVMLDERGERDAASARLAAAGALEPSSAYRALSLAGRLSYEAGDWATARERFAAALDGRPDYKEALKGLADCARRQGRAEEARHWDEVLDLVLGLTDNEHARQQKTLSGEVVQSQAERDPLVARQLLQRRASLERLVLIHPRWADAFRQLAAAQLAAGEGEAACGTLERFLALHGAGLTAEESAQLRAQYCGTGR